ncbi:MAG: 1-deoxy-D-xylulose-5-phosphate reductoisomerase [Eubacteriales bacterium]|nr:1-deoxy-D-xylulose-5-phosphate reductoisomerase [Eubacteriales bacterium]
MQYNIRINKDTEKAGNGCVADSLPDSVCILGSTGSVGRQAIDVARTQGIRVEFICSGHDIKTLEEQVREFHPRFCAVSDESKAKDLATRIFDTDTKVFSGTDGITEAISESKSSVAVNSILGEAGLVPTLAVIKSKKRLALANKESLVIAGDIVMRNARENNVEILPVDSEHSAIFQSLGKAPKDTVKRILLTASGGPFFGYDREELKKVTLEETLSHPTWNMGKKITVDSATMMNKGFEVIEAHHLFDVDVSKIQVLVHRESILHSAVEYIDNAVIAQLGVPDMRLCIQYAITYPKRVFGNVKPLDLFSVGKLTFAEPDMNSFPLLALAYKASALGGAVPAVMNAANEVAVSSFLASEIPFCRISEIVEGVVLNMEYAKKYESLDDIIASDREARRMAKNLLKLSPQ